MAKEQVLQVLEQLHASHSAIVHSQKIELKLQMCY